MDNLTVYISFSGKDIDLVKQFVSLLDQKRVSYRFSGTERIDGKITDFEEEIGRGKIIVVFFSNHYFKSLHCMNEYANIKKYWTTDKEKNFFAFKCGEVLFESLNNKLLLLFWNYKKRNLEKSDYSLLKEIEQRALNNGVYIDKNTDYCIQKLENFFTKFAYGGTIEQLADSVENKFKELLAANASLNCIKPIVQTKLALEHSGIFIKNATIEEYIAKLLDSQVSNVFVSGPSGIGKTRLIYESFYNLKDNLSVFYASYQADQENRLEDEFKNIILDKSNSNGVVIIDDCPSTFFRKLQDIRNNGQSKLKIIAANNDVSTKIIDIKNEAETIFLSPNIFKDSIECYIENELQNKGVSINTIKIIAQASDGYPQIAIKLVSNYINGKQIGWHTVEHKMPNLLDLNPQVDKRGIIIMQTLSLCMPFPYNGESRNAFKYLLNTEYFTPLGDVDYTKRRSLAEQLIHKYKSTFVDINGDWLNIHPLGLSIWLTEQWFETVCNNNEHFKELIEDVQKQDINIQNIIIDGFCRHIKQMYGVKSASDLIQELTDMDGANSFFNAEVICSRFGSELLYAMSTVNPLAVANCLYEIIDAQSIEWLKKHFADDNRRNIVFALEKMCFANESYDKAVMTMAKLAVAENDNIGNNATGLLQQLFHIRLAGTEVDLQTRLETLKTLIDIGDDYKQVVILCINSAFYIGRYVRMGNAEKFGLENKIDYIPKSDEEITNYWYACRDILIKWMEINPSVADVADQIVEENTFTWITYQLWDILFPLLAKISELKNNLWNEEYAAIKLPQRTWAKLDNSNSEQLAYWLNKLKPKSFINDLKEAQQEIGSYYQLPNEERVKLAHDICEPLAEKFINERIYDNYDELKTIITDSRYNDYWFANSVSAKMNHEIIVRCFEVMLDIILKDEEITLNRFFVNLCESLKKQPEYQDFLEKLRHKKLFLYINLLAYTEYENFINFGHIAEGISDKTLPKEVLEYYLNTFTPKFNGDYEKMVILFNEKYPNDYKLLGNYIINNHFYADNYDNTQYFAVLSKTMTNYPLAQEPEHTIYEYIQLVKDILEKTNNNEFASAINKKMIELYNSKWIHVRYEGVFDILLRKYFDVVWDYFKEKLISPDYETFCNQVKDEIGSGTGFGRGTLFQISDDRIKQLCKDNPDSAPAIIASMAPCFDFESGHENTQEQFSEWFLWLLDNFGEQRNVRSNLDCNLGSFSWTGSIIQYYRRNIRCFEKLYNHKFQEVREWARLCVKGEKEQLQKAQRFEDYEQMSEL